MKPTLTLSKKLSLILVAFFCSMLIVVVLLLNGLKNEYDRQVYSINSENTRNSLSRADSVFSSALLLSDLIVTDDFFQSTLSTIKDGDGESLEDGLWGDVIARLSTLLDSSSFIVDISIAGDGRIAGSGSGMALSSSSLSDAISLARSAEGAPVWLGSDDGSIYLVRTIRRQEFLSLDELAILLIRIDVTTLSSMLREDFSNAGMRLVFSYVGRLLYSEYPEGEKLPSSYEVVASVGNIPCYIYRGVLPQSGISYIDAVPQDSLYGGIIQRVVGAFAVLLIMLILFLLLLNHIVKRMLSRINALREKMDAFEKGSNVTSIPSLPGSDEIAQLNDHFDNMAKGYKEIVEDNYQREIMMKDSSIKILTQQINPHFLYNVLDSIYWMSQKYNADDIASMSYSLAALFRAAVSSEDLVTVHKELELLESFLDIQRSRFPDSIRYSVSVPEEVMDTMIPKFSLQPLVENAVKHSVEENGIRTEIEVSCHITEHGVLFEVSNTGSAFPENMAEKLREGIVSSSTERIGLQNIDERLNLLFGGESHLYFRNENGRAIVSFTVPWRHDDYSSIGR